MSDESEKTPAMFRRTIEWVPAHELEAAQREIAGLREANQRLFAESRATEEWKLVAADLSLALGRVRKVLVGIKNDFCGDVIAPGPLAPVIDAALNVIVTAPGSVAAAESLARHPRAVETMDMSVMTEAQHRECGCPACRRWLDTYAE